ncbi:MAG: HAD-IA family hydrolase [Sphingomonadaceae bacterium]
MHGSRRFDAILFDIGGVITSSPFEAFAAHEAARGLPPGFLRRVNALNPDSNAWARLERDEIDAATFDRLFEAEAQALGHAVPGREVLALLAGDIRPRMVAAIDALAAAGYRLGAITNNARFGEGAGMAGDTARASALAEVLARFEAVIESSKAGVRKPDPAIYRLMLDRLGLPPERCLYLDDLGINCKPAAALGMTAIKVVSEDQALADLARLTGLPLG